MVDQPGDGERGYGFAGAGFPNDCERLTLGYMKVEITDDRRKPLVSGECDAQALDVELESGSVTAANSPAGYSAFMPGANGTGKTSARAVAAPTAPRSWPAPGQAPGRRP